MEDKESNRKRVAFRALESRREGNILFILCFTAYVITYLGRLNWSAAMAEITQSGIMTKDMVGIVSTVFYAFYGGGQYLTGYIGDRVSPFNMIGAGITVSGIANILMGMVLHYNMPLYVICIVWSVNGISQAMIWSPLIRIISTVLPENQRGAACSYMLISTALGTILSYLLSTALIKYTDYSEVFAFPGIIVAAGGVLWFLFTKKTVDKTRYYTESAPVLKTRKGGSFSFMFIESGVLLMMIPTAMFSFMKDGIVTWAPTMLTETFDTTASMAVFITTLIPIANVLGAAASHFIIEKLFGNEMTASGVFFGISAILELALLLFARSNIIVMITVMSLASCILVAVSNIYVSFVPAVFAPYECVSTMTGVINASANLCFSLSSLIVGNVTERAGWNVMIILWMAFGVLGMFTSFMVVKTWGHFKKQASERKGESA